MRGRDTVVRSMHDLGLAAWFGSTLFGAVAFRQPELTPGGWTTGPERKEYDRLQGEVWRRWAPFLGTSVGVHLLGGAGLLVQNFPRVMAHSGARSNTLVKTAVTGVAVAATAATAATGARLGQVRAEAPGDEPGLEEVRLRRRLQALRWVVPISTGTLVVLTVLQGEQERPRELLSGFARTAWQVGRRAGRVGRDVVMSRSRPLGDGRRWWAVLDRG